MLWGVKSVLRKGSVKKGDYILAVKGNQKGLHDELENFFDQALAVSFEGVCHDSHCSYEEHRGHKESRKLYVSDEVDWLPMHGNWRGL